MKWSAKSKAEVKRIGQMLPKNYEMKIGHFENRTSGTVISQQRTRCILTFIATVLLVLAIFSAHAMASEVDQVNAAIQGAGANWVAGETRVSLLPPEQRRMLNGTLKREASAVRRSVPRVQAAPKAAEALPKTLDWRNYNGQRYVTSVKDQGNCGSCWAFATTAELESQMLMTEDLNLYLSEETLLACAAQDNSTCSDGGYPEVASDYIADYGLPAAACLTYQDYDPPPPCRNECTSSNRIAYQISEWDYVLSDSEAPTVIELKNALYAYGPIVSDMNVYEDFYNYVKGVYKHVSGGFDGLHEILIVGYDDTQNCFIVKNSWGTDWGEEGFFQIAYSEVTQYSGNPQADDYDLGCYAIAYHRYGSVTVNISPAAAAAAGAQWNVDNGAWMSSGNVVSDLQAGTHVIGFNSISDYIAPARQPVTISFGQTSTVTGTYAIGLTVTIVPAAAVSAGAQWQVDGGGWNNSGVTLPNLNPGQHTVTFKGIRGWTTPVSQTFTAAGQTLTATGTYTVIPSLAAFTANPTLGQAPLTVNFTDNSSGAVTSWLWNFGDGTTSSNENPVHTYAGAGVYSVTLTVNGPGGTNTATQSSYITAYTPVAAAFSATPSTGLLSLDGSGITINFTDKSTGTVTGWLWNFGDGTTSSNENPSHTYTGAGVYSVTLTVNGPGGLSSVKTLSNCITVYAPAIADFTASPTSGFASLAANFSDNSSGSISQWSWSFGDGTTSTKQNPIHTYARAGTYSVSLTVSGHGGTSTKTQSAFIYVYLVPDAGFKAAPASGLPPMTANFRDESTGTVTGWLWDFGDQQTSSDRNPVHSYNAAGTYTVTLTATGPGGASTKTQSNYINVYAPASADFTASLTSGLAPLAVNFTDNSSGSISQWSWNFGDGSGSTLQNPVHTYARAGTYSVRLTVSGHGGRSTKTQSAYVYVYLAPGAGFKAAPASGWVPLSVHFTNTSSGTVTGWLWDFGDQQTSTDPNPVHIYNTAGTYTVKLTATGPGGASTKTQSNYITVRTRPPVTTLLPHQ